MNIRVSLLLGSVICFSCVTLGFIPSTPFRRTHESTLTHYLPAPTNHFSQSTSTATTLFENKLWDRMEIEEDEEPMWYVLNCVAGLELDLLRQCRQRCEDMKDVQKFVVPMETAVRSHGAKRMVKDTKVKYQGYVFAKLRLCAETYEAIQGLDLCRSWMGTINQKGYKKLPPAPLSLNEDEIEKFGLEDLESKEPDEPEEEDNIILDTAEADQEAAELEEEVQKVYKGLRVDDMVKVTAKNKFYDEDAVVRRLKGGKIFLRFYTYGTMYEEWMDPGDVRKLSSVEILKGLSGPQQPVTQREFDRPNQYNRRGGSDDDKRSRRNEAGTFGGGSRDRRQERTVGRFQRDSNYDQQRNDDNWNWYKDNERRDQGGSYRDGDYDMRGSDRYSQQGERRQSNRAQNDIDSQWGRNSQWQDRREKQQRRNDNEDDWSAFVSPSKERPSKEETDDFFASLMTDLSNDLSSEGGSKAGKSNGGGLSSDEDDFFASLISEIGGDGASSLSIDDKALTSDEDDFFASVASDLGGETIKKATAAMTKTKSKGPSNSLSDGDDFFERIMGELGESLQKEPVQSSEEDDFFASVARDSNKQSADTISSGEDDFFAALASELGEPVNGESVPEASRAVTEPALSSSEEDFFAALSAGAEMRTPKKGKTKSDEIDDFFAEIGLFDDEDSSKSGDNTASEPKDFFADLEKELSVDTSQPDATVAKASKRVQQVDETTTTKSRKSRSTAPTKNIGVSNLEQLTVPALKKMLREKGLKVSGKKSELIERLASQL